MRIGYSVEGSTDRALIRGLQKRWCPDAELVEGRFRGARLRMHQIRKLCIELAARADIMVILADSDSDDPEEWRSRLGEERSQVPDEYRDRIAIGVCQRNVECWLCADSHWISAQAGLNYASFSVPDPKGIFESSFRITYRDRRENEIEDLIQKAPLRNWLSRSPSFESFYDSLWAMSKRNECRIENLREKPKP